MTDPARFYANNVVNTLCLLQAMRRAGVQRIVLSSTAAVYGWPQRIPIPEDHLLAPNNPYGATKHACESMLADFARAYGLRSIALRYFNACGADPDGEIGEAHDPETHLIPLVLRTAAGESGDIAIFGDDYETPDGTCLRDYVHVSDIADAHVAALRHLERHDGAQVYNLGTGRGHSVREVIACAERVCGRRIPARLRPRRPGDPPMLVADPTKAMNVLGWYPRWPDLESQIVHAWQWQCRRVDTAGPPRVRLVPEQRRKFNGAHR